MSERPQLPLERVLAEAVRNGVYKPKEFHGRGANMVNMGELFAYPRLRYVSMRRVELSAPELDRFSLARGDLLFARRSLVAEGAGKCSIVLELDGPTAFESSIIRARPDRTKVEPLFLYYWFNSPAGLHSLDTIRRQVAVAGITGSDLSQLAVPVPPLAEQRRIASNLGALDDKIELNRDLIEGLGRIGRALYEQTFIVNHDGRMPLRGSIGDVAEVVDCLHSKKPMRQAAGRPLLQLDNIRAHGLLDLSDPYLIGDDDYRLWSSRIEVATGDCVITNVGRVGAVAQIPEGVRAALGRNMTAVRPRAEFPFPSFLIEALRSDAMRTEISLKTDAGTILEALNVRNIPRLRIPIPALSDLVRFERMTRPLRERMESALVEIGRLAALRDGLLHWLLCRDGPIASVEEPLT